MRRGLLLAATAVASVVMALSASAAHTVAPWVMTTKGTSFSGVFTNTTASPITGVAMGTSEKANNAITSATFQGQTCLVYAPYGSVACDQGVDVEPGKSATFSGVTQKPTTQFVDCSSADRGMDNTCTDVTVPTRKVNAAVVQAMVSDLNQLVDGEESALKSIAHGDYAHAEAGLDAGKIFEYLAAAVGKVGVSTTVGSDIARAEHDDEDALAILRQVHPEKHVKALHKLIYDAMHHKLVAISELKSLLK